MSEFDEQTRPVLMKYSKLRSSSKILVISDLVYVRERMHCVMVKWENIGLHWGIHPDMLDQISHKHRRDLDACFTEMIAEWLRNPKEMAEPTWKAVVIAISENAAGGDPAAAMRLVDLCAENGVDSLSHVPQADGVDDAELSIEDAKKIQKALHPVSAYWKEIGIILGLPFDTLKAIDRPGNTIDDCILSMVKKWLKKKYDYVNVGVPSWKKLVEAIGARTGGNNSKHASDVAKNHKLEPRVKRPCPEESNEKEASYGGTGPATATNGVKAEADRQLEKRDEHVASKFLKGIPTANLISLGQYLGLDRNELQMSNPKELAGDLIAQWIRRDYRVLEVSGQPTWRSLAKALQEEDLTGTSLNVQEKYNFSL